MQPLFKTCYQAPINTQSANSTFLKSLFLCLTLLVAFPKLSQAHQIDIQATTIGINFMDNNRLVLLPGLGIAYDFRNPSDRAGWSLVPAFFHITNLDTNELATFFIPAALVKYRYYFNRWFAMDFNIGVGLAIMHKMVTSKDTIGNIEQDRKQARISKDYIPIPLVSLDFLYCLNNGIMLGTNLAAFYQDGLFPLINLQCLFPITHTKSKSYRRNR